MSASVKIMLSYDYCHFEICKGTDAALSDQQIDEMRKDCQRLADKAVAQYKIAKSMLQDTSLRQSELESLRRDVRAIESKPEGERTINEIAKMKLLKDRDWKAYIDERYDYQDDWAREEDDEDEGR